MVTQSDLFTPTGVCADYALMLPPTGLRYAWSPVWVRGPQAATGGDVVGLPSVLEDVACDECREDIVLSHVEVLNTWIELATELLEETARRDDRREEIAQVLVFFAGDLAGALNSGGIGVEMGPESIGVAMAAIAETMVVIFVLSGPVVLEATGPGPITAGRRPGSGGAGGG